jgi:hypothetical protein
MIGQLNLDFNLLENMFNQIKGLIDCPISMDAFYLEMRLCNDPNTGKHAEDFNQMVTEMVEHSKKRTNMNMGPGITNSLEEATHGAREPILPQPN